MNFATLEDTIPANMYAHNCVEIHLRNTITLIFTFNEQPMEIQLQGCERAKIMDKLRALIQSGKTIQTIRTMEEETLANRYTSDNGIDHVNIIPLPGRTQIIMITFGNGNQLSGQCPHYSITKRTVVERNVTKHPAHRLNEVR